MQTTIGYFMMRPIIPYQEGSIMKLPDAEKWKFIDVQFLPIVKELSFLE
jgi:hypothetical protein